MCITFEDNSWTGVEHHLLDPFIHHAHHQRGCGLPGWCVCKVSLGVGEFSLLCGKMCSISQSSLQGSKLNSILVIKLWETAFLWLRGIIDNNKTTITVSPRESFDMMRQRWCFNRLVSLRHFRIVSLLFFIGVFSVGGRHGSAFIISVIGLSSFILTIIHAVYCCKSRSQPVSEWTLL